LNALAKPTISLPIARCKETVMDVAARVTSKGQVTVPKAVREALGIAEGDHVVFRVEGTRAVLARTPDLLALAGSVPVPATKRNVAWDEVIWRTRSDRAASRR
jgi:antitoxin PrlF